jgi:hypothetical protein
MNPIFVNFLESLIGVLKLVFSLSEGLVTLLVGLFAFVLYSKTRNDTKRDAAKLILQEIRYADQRVRNYKTYSSYNFTEKILPTNSWHKNINLFIRDLSESELDLISKFFSSATYLDDVIKSIADTKNRIHIQSDLPAVSGGTEIVMGTGSLNDDDPSKRLIEAISKDIESIYNTPAADKLRTISIRRYFYFL